MSPSPPLRKSGKDAPLEAGLLTHGPNTDLLSAPSHPLGQWLFVADFVAVHSCEGSGGFAPLFPLTSNASCLSRRDAKSALCSCNFSPVKQSELQQVGLFTKRELTEWEEAVNWTAKIQTPSISCVEDRGRPKIHCSRDQVIDGLPNFGGALTLISALDATRPFPERKWSLPSNSRQGFLTSGSNASLHGLPNLLMRSVATIMEATQSPVHSGGNRAGFTPASLV